MSNCGSYGFGSPLLGLKSVEGVSGGWKKTSGPVFGLRHLSGFHDVLPVYRAYNFSAMNKMAKSASVPTERPTPRPTWIDLELEVAGYEGDDEEVLVVVGRVEVVLIGCVVLVLEAAELSEEAVERTVAVWIRLLMEIIVIASPSGTEKVP